MPKYRVDWKEDGVNRSRMYPGHSEFSAIMFHDSLKASAKNPRIKTRISGVTLTTVSDSQVWKPSYHTPVRVHRKLTNKPTDRIKR